MANNETLHANSAISSRVTSSTSGPAVGASPGSLEASGLAP
jgi:hypothetical protein